MIRHPRSAFPRLTCDRRGAATYEHGLVVAAIVLGAVVGARNVGFGLSDVFWSVANARGYSGPVIMGGNLPPGSVDPLQTSNSSGSSATGGSSGTTTGGTAGGTGGTTNGGTTTTAGTAGGATTTGGTTTGGTTTGNGNGNGNGNGSGNGIGNGGGNTTVTLVCPAGQKVVGNKCK